MLVWLKHCDGDWTVAEKLSDEQKELHEIYSDTAFFYLIGHENPFEVNELTAMGYDVASPATPPLQLDERDKKVATSTVPQGFDKVDMTLLRSLQEWNKLGRWIKKGSKAQDFKGSIALFSYAQTREAPPSSPIDFKALAKSKPPVDDLEDDIPF